MSDGITEAYKNVQTLTHDHKQETPYTKQIWAYLEKVEADNAALREQVKRLSTCGTDHSTPWWQVKCEDLEVQLATLQAQLADRDAMILQMGEQAAVLAKENMAVKAQLRQVEGERDAADAELHRDMVEYCQFAHEIAMPGTRLPEQVDDSISFGKLKDVVNAIVASRDTLRQLLEDVLHTFGYLRFHRVAGMDGLLYETHNKMSPERTVEACEKRIRATLAAQDAGKEVSSG